MGVLAAGGGGEGGVGVVAEEGKKTLCISCCRPGRLMF